MEQPQSAETPVEALEEEATTTTTTMTTTTTTTTTGGDQEQHRAASPLTVSTCTTAKATTAADISSQEETEVQVADATATMERRQDVDMNAAGSGENETETASTFNATNVKESVNNWSSSSIHNDADVATMTTNTISNMDVNEHVKEEKEEVEQEQKQADNSPPLPPSNQSNTAAVTMNDNTENVGPTSAEPPQEKEHVDLNDDDAVVVDAVSTVMEPETRNVNDLKTTTTTTTTTASPENSIMANDGMEHTTSLKEPVDSSSQEVVEQNVMNDVNNEPPPTASTDSSLIENMEAMSHQAVVLVVENEPPVPEMNQGNNDTTTTVETSEQKETDVAISSAIEPETSTVNDLKTTTTTTTLPENSIMANDGMGRTTPLNEQVDPSSQKVVEQRVMNVSNEPPPAATTESSLVENMEDASTSHQTVVLVRETKLGYNDTTTTVETSEQKETTAPSSIETSMLPAVDDEPLPSFGDQQQQESMVKDAAAAAAAASAVVTSDQTAVTSTSTVEEPEAVEPTRTTNEALGTTPLPPQTPPPATKDVDAGMLTPAAVATETSTANIDGDATPSMSTATPSASPVLAPSNGSGGDAIGTATDDDAGSKLQSPPRLSGKTSSPQGVMDFHNVQEQSDDAMYHSVALFPVSSPQRQEAQLSTTTITTTAAAVPSSSLDPKESILSEDDGATSFLSRGPQSPNKVKDIYRPNEKKEETKTHGFAELSKQNSLRNKQREDGLNSTNVTSIRKMFEKKTTSDTPMSLEAFNQQQSYRRQQEQEQKIEALAKMHGFSKEVIAEYLKKSAQGEVDYSHLAKLQDEIDKLKNANETPVGMGRLEKSPHRRTKSTGEIDASHVVNVDGVDRSDWKGPLTTALSADAAGATGIIHPDCKATDYRGMIFVVHHQEGLMLLRGKDEDVDKAQSTSPDVSNTTGAHETSVPGGSPPNTTLELHASDSLLEQISAVKSLNDITAVGVDAATPLYQLPGGRIGHDDALAAAQKSSNPQRQLLLAARAGAARQLFESTGIDVRSRLKDLVPAILKPNCNDNAESAPQLPNEHHSNIFFFLNVTDDDFVRADEIKAASEVEPQDGKEVQPAVAEVKEGAPVVNTSDIINTERPTVPVGERLLLKLSDEHSGFVFEKEPARATELLKSDNTNIGVLSSEALELLTQQQQTLADKTSGDGGAASSHDKSAPFTLDRFLQRQYHPAIGSLRSLADAKDGVSEDAAHASECEEMTSCCQGGTATAAAAAASSPSALVDHDLQKSLDKCACCIVM